MPGNGVALGTHQSGCSNAQRIGTKKELENSSAS
jgi:hypothetical protein